MAENIGGLICEFVMMLLSFTLSVLRAVWQAVGWVPSKSVSGDIAVVTGAGSGIGRLMSLELASRGAVIVAWDINTAGNEETVNLIKANGGKAYAYTVDVSSRESIYKTAQRVKSEVGQVAILINNAGIVYGKKLLDSTDDQVIKTFEVNVLSHFWTSRAFLAQMLASDHGHIVNIASVAGLVGCNRLLDYCSSKFADVGFTETLDMEVTATGRHGVHTTLVCPFYIGTGMFEGCQSRFPWLLPVLDPEWTAKKIIKALLTNQKQLFIPKSMYFFYILKSILPTEATLILHKYLGSTTFMDTFTGRQVKNK